MRHRAELVRVTEGVTHRASGAEWRRQRSNGPTISNSPMAVSSPAPVLLTGDAGSAKSLSQTVTQLKGFAPMIGTFCRRTCSPISPAFVYQVPGP